jgi:GNAT superfamily N-acetyltransferase
VSAIQDATQGVMGFGWRKGVGLPAPHADGLWSPRVGHDERPCRIPRRRAGRLVPCRAAECLPAPVDEDPRPLGGPSAGQDGRQRLARDLLRHRTGFRRRGISRRLARAAVDYARRRGARALEGYPMIDHAAWADVMPVELHVGSHSIFADRVRRDQSSDSPQGRDAHGPLGGSRTRPRQGTCQVAFWQHSERSPTTRCWSRLSDQPYCLSELSVRKHSPQVYCPARARLDGGE